MQKVPGADPDTIGKVVTVQTFNVESTGDLIPDSLTKHVGTLEAYILKPNSFEFKLVGMNAVEAQYAEVYLLGTKITPIDQRTGWRLGSRPRTADPMSAEKIAALRSKLHLTRGELASELDVTAEHVRLLENGQRKPSEPVNQILHDLEAETTASVPPIFS